jgi:hypothetical protein
MRTFSSEEVQLLIEALARAASRHESQARWNPRGAKPHDDKAAKMRKLRTRLMQESQYDLVRPA